MSLDLEDFLEQVSEHKTYILIGVCGLIVVGNFIFGGGDQLKEKFARDSQESAARDAQARAEAIYSEQGCIAQAVSLSTKTSNFMPGEIALDPLSITPQNPAGTAINSGYICSTDGSLFKVQNGIVKELIGTSPQIRNDLVSKGFATEAVKMQQRAQSMYGDQQQ